MPPLCKGRWLAKQDGGVVKKLQQEQSLRLAPRAASRNDGELYIKPKNTRPSLKAQIFPTFWQKLVIVKILTIDLGGKNKLFFLICWGEFWKI